MPRPWTAFFTPEPQPPSKPASSGRELALPFTSLFAAALSIGVSFERASRMTFPEIQMLASARSDMNGKEGAGARAATQADIRKLIG